MQTLKKESNISPLAHSRETSHRKRSAQLKNNRSVVSLSSKHLRQ